MLPRKAPLAPLRMADTAVPDAVVSSSVPASATVAPLLRVGASLPALTTSEAPAACDEKAVLPPPAPGLA